MTRWSEEPGNRVTPEPPCTRREVPGPAPAVVPEGTAWLR